MGTIRTPLRRVSHVTASYSLLTCNCSNTSGSLHSTPLSHSLQLSSVGLAEEEDVEVAQSLEFRFAMSNEEEAGLGSDFTALPYCHGCKKYAVVLCVYGVAIFTIGMHTHSPVSS